MPRAFIKYSLEVKIADPLAFNSSRPLTLKMVGDVLAARGERLFLRLDPNRANQMVVTIACAAVDLGMSGQAWRTFFFVFGDTEVGGRGNAILAWETVDL